MKNKESHSSTPFDYESFEKTLLEGLKEGQDLLGTEGLLTPLIKRVIEASLEREMEDHLLESRDYENNRRNGKSSKRVKSSIGEFELNTPRDRTSSFEPKLVQKRQTVLNKGLDTKILSLYANGMSYRDIRDNIEELYGVEISQGQLTSITDSILPVIKEWRNRPLESVYPIVFMDAMFFKIREDNQVKTKCLYTIVGINQKGLREILGFYISESEGATFWLSVLTDLKNRGLEDILIASIDGLKGFPEAIESIFPKTQIQLCIVHQIRNSLKFVSYKERKTFASDLKQIYKADTKELAEEALLSLEDKWSKKYPLVIKSWKANWEQISTYFQFHKDIRDIIYTTNIIEGLHRQIRKYTKTKAAFVSENALIKLVYCACMKASKKWTLPRKNWTLILSQLDIHFPGRLRLELRC